MHADSRGTSEPTLTIQRLHHMYAFTLYFLSNLIFYRAHSSTFTIGRADSAEGHPDTWAEWMTFRVQFPIFHHFLWKVLLFMDTICNHPHKHTHICAHDSSSRLLAITELFVLLWWVIQTVMTKSNRSQSHFSLFNRFWTGTVQTGFDQQRCIYNLNSNYRPRIYINFGIHG